MFDSVTIQLQLSVILEGVFSEFSCLYQVQNDNASAFGTGVRTAVYVDGRLDASPDGCPDGCLDGQLVGRHGGHLQSRLDRRWNGHWAVAGCLLRGLSGPPPRSPAFRKAFELP